MRISTKIFLIATLLSSHLLGLVTDARSNALLPQAPVGVTPPSKGNATLWKLQTEPKQVLTISVQNARPAFYLKAEEHTCSKIYASAVSEIFHSLEVKATKSMYKSINLAAFAPGRDVRNSAPSINAYPNPSRGVTRFTLSQNGNDNYRIKISNTIGKVVQSAELPVSNSTNMYEFDLSTLPAGIYFYSLLVNDKTVETKRLILQK